jgi:hypothetical protein
MNGEALNEGASKEDVLSIDDAQKVAAMMREDKKYNSQVLIDTHNRRAGKLQWLRMALGLDNNSNLGGFKSIFEGNQLAALTDRYARCLLAWTRSDETDGIVEVAAVVEAVTEAVRPEPPYTT